MQRFVLLWSKLNDASRKFEFIKCGTEHFSSSNNILFLDEAHFHLNDQVIITITRAQWTYNASMRNSFNYSDYMGCNVSSMNNRCVLLWRLNVPLINNLFLGTWTAIKSENMAPPGWSNVAHFKHVSATIDFQKRWYKLTST